jgi:thiaminase
MSHFEALEIYQDFCVNLQFAEMQNKERHEIVLEWVQKYGKEKIAEAVEILCKVLDEKKKHYIQLLKIAGMVRG